MNQNPFFPVVRKPLTTRWRDPEIDWSVEVDVGRDALINGETGQVVGIVAPKYQIVTNRSLADKIDQMTERMRFQDVTDHLDAKTGRWVREIILDGDEYSFDVTGNHDIVKTKLQFFNSYDGKRSAGWRISGWRKICHNGMMGWRNFFSERFPHLTDDIVDRFMKMFVEKHMLFGTEMTRFEFMTRDEFNQEEYNVFVKTRTLPDRTKQALLDYYGPTVDRFNENTTRWGAYNVLTAYATHETKARGGSNIFSAGHKQIEKVVEEFLSWYPTKAEFFELEDQIREIEDAKERD